jgi:hypothetical protein
LGSEGFRVLGFWGLSVLGLKLTGGARLQAGVEVSAKQKYTTQRIPSYTDRILYHSLPAFRDDLKQNEYNSDPHVSNQSFGFLMCQNVACCANVLVLLFLLFVAWVEPTRRYTRDPPPSNVHLRHFISSKLTDRVMSLGQYQGLDKG